jgi:hypothetical protein
MFTRMRVMLAAGALAISGATAAGVLAAGPASAAPSQVVAVNCGHGLVRPATFDFNCNAAHQFLSGLTWTSWAGTAYGRGTLEVNNCVPNCAQGHFVKYPALVVLWKPQARPGHAGQRYFSKLTWILTGKRPQHAGIATTTTLQSS